jgi:hypothetical protein
LIKKSAGKKTDRIFVNLDTLNICVGTFQKRFQFSGLEPLGMAICPMCNRMDTLYHEWSANVNIKSRRTGEWSFVEEGEVTRIYTHEHNLNNIDMLDRLEEARETWSDWTFWIPPFCKHGCFYLEAVKSFDKQKGSLLHQRIRWERLDKFLVSVEKEDPVRLPFTLPLNDSIVEPKVSYIYSTIITALCREDCSMNQWISSSLKDAESAKIRPDNCRFDAWLPKELYPDIISVLMRTRKKSWGTSKYIHNSNCWDLSCRGEVVEYSPIVSVGQKYFYKYDESSYVCPSCSMCFDEAGKALYTGGYPRFLIKTINRKATQQSQSGIKVHDLMCIRRCPNQGCDVEFRFDQLEQFLQHTRKCLNKEL